MMFCIIIWIWSWTFFFVFFVKHIIVGHLFRQASIHHPLQFTFTHSFILIFCSPERLKKKKKIKSFNMCSMKEKEKLTKEFEVCSVWMHVVCLYVMYVCDSISMYVCMRLFMYVWIACVVCVRVWQRETVCMCVCHGFR